MNKMSENIESTLNSLDGLQRATPGPFFYTRVSARLLNRQKTVWESLSQLLARPAIVVAGLCFVVIVNILAIIKQPATTTSVAATSELMSSPDEYTLAASNFYDIENTDLR